jgi:hypothetical protein
MDTNPAIAILEREREALRTAIADAEAKVRNDRITLRSLDDAILRLSGGAGQTALPAPATERGAKLKDAVLEIVQERPNGSTNADLLECLERRGRPTEINSLLSTLSRLKAAGLIHKGANKLWFPGSGSQAAMTEQEIEDLMS